MANRERGEVRLEVDGEAVVLRLTVNAMCQIEGALKREGREMSFPEFAARLKFAFLTDMRLFVWGALLDQRPKTTVEEAGRMIDRAGGPTAFFERHVAVMLGTAEPDPADLQALTGGRADPPHAVPGPGGISRSRRGERGSGQRGSGGSRFASFFGRWWSHKNAAEIATIGK